MIDSSPIMCNIQARLRGVVLGLLVALSAVLQAQVKVSAPQQVVKGVEFRLQYVIDGSDFQGISLGSTDGFDILAGPYTSRHSSFQMINGKTSQSSSTTVTYTLMANKEGKHTIGAATVACGGKNITTNTATIEVLPPDSQASGSNQSSRNSRGNSRQSGNNGFSHDDLFISVTASKKRVFEQEAVLLTYKLYTLVNVSSLSGELPDLKGCHVQELNQSQERSLSLEQYNGRNYRTCVWSQYLIFPQQTGKVTIPQVNFDAIAYRSVASQDPFDWYFNGGSITREVKLTVTAPSVEITVDPLPTPQPANFSGAVGQFTMTSTLTPSELKANEALTMQIVVKGKGNIKLMKEPTVKFPKDFETYDAKVADTVRTTAQGVSGTRSYRYIAVPRFGGNYEIPAAEFCYFDPQAKQYKTLTSDAYSVTVQRGEGEAQADHSTSLQKEELEMLAHDIRFIKRGDTHVADSNDTLLSSAAYWLSYVAMLAVLGIAMLVSRRRIAANADVTGTRKRKANKLASRRLRAAGRMLKNHDKDAFYDELLKALWGYVADKLNIDVSQLNRDNVAERLAQNGVGNDTITQFMSVLDDCEFARYAPGDPAANMDKIFNNAESVIGKI